MHPNVDLLLINQKRSLRDVLECIDQNAQGIAFIVDDEQRLTGVLTDGDLRRAFLKGYTLETIAKEILGKKFVSKSVDTPSEELLNLLRGEIQYIPLVDDAGRVVDYASESKTHRIPIMEPFLNGNELNYVIDCVKSKWISSQGKYVTTFEKMFQERFQSSNAIAVSNGTVALHLALVALGIGPGDEVIVPDLTFAATINTVIHAGATPVVVDIMSSTWCIDPEKVRRAITPRTKAIMPVHLYGHPSDMDQLMNIAKEHRLFVIEDAAEALGAEYRGKSAGTIGDAGCFSFFGNKMITTGEGGLVVFKNPEVAERARMLRDHGMSKEKRYWHLEVGYNYRMTNLQAAIGVAQLEQFDEIFRRKMQLAKSYSDALKGVSGVMLPPQNEGVKNSYWLYTVLFDDKIFGSTTEISRKLAFNGVETRRVFWPLHQMDVYKKYCSAGDYPNSDFVSSHGLSLPSSAELTASDVHRISYLVSKILSFQQIRA